MTALLDLAIEAHGGMRRWSEIHSIEIQLEISGALMEIKGFPEPLNASLSIDMQTPRVVFQPYGGTTNRGVFTPQNVWIEGLDGVEVDARENPRAAFAGHTRATEWDELHRLYFLGYAMWNYLCAPFMFSKPGFELKELAEHAEDGEIWRVLEVTYPPDIPAHCATQRYYFDQDGHLKRIDYVTDVAGGVASHYCYDPKTFDGIVIPTRRRVVRRTPEGPKVSGITAVFLDYKLVTLKNRHSHD